MSTNRPTLQDLFNTAYNSLSPGSMATAGEITENLNDFVRVLISYPGQDNNKMASEMISCIDFVAHLASGTLKNTMRIVGNILQLYINHPTDYNKKLQMALLQLDESIAKQLAETLNTSPRPHKKREYFVAEPARVRGSLSGSPSTAAGSSSDDDHSTTTKRARKKR